MNLVVSDEKRLVASKYATTGYAHNNLYYRKRDKYNGENGVCHMEEGEENSA
ncbi:hypothetical protein [Candidatus Uabimicrobium sp. HlEnr_7]|uniref:hypothetical protein n=1 Tax=Candidatus Uabimicrobium helgolandensis TaxID=3095367 RepID=UPI003557BA46